MDPLSPAVWIQVHDTPHGDCREESSRDNRERVLVQIGTNQRLAIYHSHGEEAVYPTDLGLTVLEYDPNLQNFAIHSTTEWQAQEKQGGSPPNRSPCADRALEFHLHFADVVTREDLSEIGLDPS